MEESDPAAGVAWRDTEISDALGAFLKRRHIGHVHYAESGATTPQPLAYFVHFPRAYVALSGQDTMWIESGGEPRELRLAAGDAVILPAGCWNRQATAQPGTALNLLFGRNQVGLSLVTHSGRHATPRAVKTTLQGAKHDAPRSIMHALLTVRASGGDAALPLFESLLRATLNALRTAKPEPRRRTVDLHESICMYVQEHFQSPLTRESVAGHFRISPPHVSRLFKREGMVSFVQYVTYVRMNGAKHLLRQHRQSVDEVATMCGFQDTSYFCRVFKAHTGLTPSEYRQQRQV